MGKDPVKIYINFVILVEYAFHVNFYWIFGRYVGNLVCYYHINAVKIRIFSFRRRKLFSTAPVFPCYVAKHLETCICFAAFSFFFLQEGICGVKLKYLG